MRVEVFEQFEKVSRVEFILITCPIIVIYSGTICRGNATNVCYGRKSCIENSSMILTHGNRI